MYKSIVVAAAILIAGADACLAATPSATDGHYDLAAAMRARVAMQAQVAHASLATNKGGASGAKPDGRKPAEIYANVDRAYPPSCLSDGLPLGGWVNDPKALQTTITLPGDPLAPDPNEQGFRETETVTLFRVVCSGGTSATLLEIDRPSNHSTSYYPTFPGVSVQQGNNNIYIRLASDANTVYSNVYGFAPVLISDIWVLENYSGDSVQMNYNQSFSLTVDNFILNDQNRYTTFPMPAYNPANYAEASQPLPISGYMSTNWSNPNQGGEGMVLQVYDNNDNATRTLSFAWFTYDNLGLPFWLYGDGSLPIGARTVTISAEYFKGGAFAPSTQQPDVPLQPWGNVTFTFPDCNTMNISYSGDASADNGPTGTSTRTFLRVANVNSLVCQ
jgi:hypothetical protein